MSEVHLRTYKFQSAFDKLRSLWRRNCRAIYHRLPWLVHARAFQRSIACWPWDVLKILGNSNQNLPALQLLARKRVANNLQHKRNAGVAPSVIDLSVVTYNSGKWLGPFISSLLAQAYPTKYVNLIFVDHGSTDGTMADLRSARARLKSSFANFIIIEQENLGFGAGHDRAIRESRSEFVLVSNVDLEFLPDSISSVVDVAVGDTAEVAAWELRQVPHEHPKHYDPVTLETQWQSHACVLMRREAYEKVGGYEPAIFMYGEDVELSYRFRSFGYVLRYCPSAVVQHYCYDEGKQLLKPLQFAGGAFANAAIRLRYGTRKDRITAFLLLFWLAARLKQPFPDSRAAILVNLRKLALKTRYFMQGKGKCSTYFPFRFLDFEMTRLGAIYKVTPISCGPLVTIITRTYDAPGRDQFLRQAGCSIINQTYRDIEWIVVQDGGDSLRATAESVAAEVPWIKLHFLALPKNGRSSAGNAGLEVANGTFCMFLDDDDLLYADHVEVLVGELLRKPLAAAAYALATEIHSDCHHGLCNEIDYINPGLFHQDWNYEVLLDHNFIPIQSLLFRRDLYITRGGFDVSLDHLEDWNLWLRYGHANKFIFIPKTTSLFRTPASREIRVDRHVELHRAYNRAKFIAIKKIEENTH